MQVAIGWSGPNGIIANESGRMTVIPTTSDGHIHISTLQFSSLKAYLLHGTFMH